MSEKEAAATEEQAAADPQREEFRRARQLPGQAGIAISARTGAGKSSIFLGSRHVIRVAVADTGSGQHAIYARPESQVTIIRADDPTASPIQTVWKLLQQWHNEGALGCLDSFTTLQELQVAWVKRFKTGGSISLPNHQAIVGDLRDLALALASSSVFTLFNTSPGGQVQNPDGSRVQIPKGIIVGYPALSGLSEGKESVLSRFTSSFIITPGAAATANRPEIPRGFMLPNADLRDDTVANFAPIKDALRILRATEREVEVDGVVRVVKERVDAFTSIDEEPMIDVLIERIGKKFPMIYESPVRRPQAAPPQTTGRREESPPQQQSRPQQPQQRGRGR